MPTYLAPGVYVEELDGGSKPLEAAGTAVGAFVGFTSTFPTDDPADPRGTRPRFVSNWTQFETLFGGGFAGEGPFNRHGRHAGGFKGADEHARVGITLEEAYRRDSVEISVPRPGGKPQRLRVKIPAVLTEVERLGATAVIEQPGRRTDSGRSSTVRTCSRPGTCRAASCWYSPWRVVSTSIPGNAASASRMTCMGRARVRGRPNPVFFAKGPCGRWVGLVKTVFESVAVRIASEENVPFERREGQRAIGRPADGRGHDSRIERQTDAGGTSAEAAPTGINLFLIAAANAHYQHAARLLDRGAVHDVDGVPVAVPNVKTRISFKIEE